MTDLKFALRRLRKHPGCAAVAVLSGALLSIGRAFADLDVRHVEIAPRAPGSHVPEITIQGRFLAPQAISAVDVSADGNFITVGTMAFSHDANVWPFGPDGRVLAQRHFPPWAPMQVATLPGGRAMADALVPDHVATAVALNSDGSRVAVVEYGVWSWARSKPAIGGWNPPIHTQLVRETEQSVGRSAPAEAKSN